MRFETWLREDGTTIVHEFLDLGDAQRTARRIASVHGRDLDGLLGLEREHRGKAAGLRTHMLVAISAALFVRIPEQASIDELDLSLALQDVTTMAGILGAGAIIKSTSEK